MAKKDSEGGSKVEAARHSWWHGHLGRVFHGMQDRAILGNYRIIYMAKHVR